MIEPLAEPTQHGGNAEDAFHVICPSLPGYGFSGKPTSAGWNVEKIAAAWDELMQRLGYESYYAQGGDWGSGRRRIAAAARGTEGWHRAIQSEGGRREVCAWRPAGPRLLGVVSDLGCRLTASPCRNFVITQNFSVITN